MDLKTLGALALMGALLTSPLTGSVSQASPITAPVISTFDLSLEGWTLVPASDTGFLSFSGTIGNPSGSALFTDGAGGANGTIRAPAAFLGDWSLATSLQYQHKIIRLGGAPTIDQVFYVWISGPGGSARFDSDPNVVLPSTQDWIDVVAPLDPTRWLVTSGDWSGLIASVTRLDIDIEQVRN